MVFQQWSGGEEVPVGSYGRARVIGCVWGGRGVFWPVGARHRWGSNCFRVQERPGSDGCFGAARTSVLWVS